MPGSKPFFVFLVVSFIFFGLIVYTKKLICFFLLTIVFSFLATIYITMFYQIVIVLLILWNFKAARDLAEFIFCYFAAILCVLACLLYNVFIIIFKFSWNLIRLLVSMIFCLCYWLYFYSVNRRFPDVEDVEELFGCNHYQHEIEVSSKGKTYVFVFKDEPAASKRKMCLPPTKTRKCIHQIESNPKSKLCLPPALTARKNVTVKCPIITIFHNISFISIFNEFTGEYEALDGWNGIHGTELYISFDQKKPKYGKDAAKIYNSKSSFVVYDLIHIMSVPPEKLKPKPEYGFKITKDDAHDVLLEFDNFDGTRKAATPQFLFAMLLKQHLKAIAAETGEKPSQISYAFTDLGKQKIKRVNPLIREACELLNVEVVDFKKV